MMDKRKVSQYPDQEGSASSPFGGGPWWEEETSFCCGKKLTIVCVMNLDKESAPFASTEEMAIGSQGEHR
jgi:hypothetical protein